MGQPRLSLSERFWNKVYLPPCADDCWSWTAHITPVGYGQFGVGNRLVYAHRLAYELVIGVIPDGLHIDHLCRNRACVNPRHLEPVTQMENNRRAVEALGHWNSNKTHCKHGHLFTPENTYRYPNGTRCCRTCNNRLAKASRTKALLLIH